MQYNKDRRFARHGSNIINPTESKGDFFNRPSVYETAVVVDFVSDPISFLNEKIEIVDLNNENIKTNKIANNRKNIFNKLKESTRRENLFNRNLPTFNSKDNSVTKQVSRLEAYTLESSSEKVDNSDLISVMPRNSIIAINITKGNIKSSSSEVFLPFFSSHICLPVKPGEHVWCFYDNVGGKKIGYWISRKTALLPVEDVNYTHADRNDGINEAIYTINSKNANQIEKRERLKSIFTNFSDSLSSVDPDSTSLKDLDYDDIVINSKSYNEDFIGQAVPRYNKKCSDLILQGSNNTVIALTHSGESNSGTITIAAGRPIIPSSLVRNNRSLKAKDYEYEEEDKSEDVITNENLEQLEVNNFVKNLQHNNIELANSYLMIKEEGSINLKSNEFKASATQKFEVNSLRTTIQGGNIIMNSANEPYVIHSALKEMLEALLSDVKLLNVTMVAVIEAVEAVVEGAVTAALPPAAGVLAGEAAKKLLNEFFTQKGVPPLEPVITVEEYTRITQSPEGPLNQSKSKTIFGSI